jgi:hypothetical protein
VPAATLLVCAGAAAQENAGPPLVNFVFASQLGSGVYEVGDRTVQVYRVPIPLTIRSEESHRWGIRLEFPVSLGFYGFETGDLFEGNLPEDVATVSLGSALELPTRLGDHWTLAPRAEISYARDVSNDVDSMVYAAGLRSEGVFARERNTVLLHGRLVWAGQSASRLTLDDDFLRLQAAVELRHPLPWGTRRRAFDIGVFVAAHVYFDSVAFFRFPQEIRVQTVEEIEESEVSAQGEVGATLGSSPAKISWIPVPRLGVSYRFGEDVSSVRFVIGSVF